MATVESLSLRKWLKDHNLPVDVCDALDKEQVTLEEIQTYTESDLLQLCEQLNLKFTLQKRLINAVKKLPNSQAKCQLQYKLIKIILSDKEYQQMTSLSLMTTALNQLNQIIETKSKLLNITKQKTNEQMQQLIESLSKSILDNVSKQQYETKNILYVANQYDIIVSFCFLLYYIID